MPSLCTLTPLEFETVNTNLNVELIVPILFDVGVLTLQDRDKVASKSQKPAVKLILQRLKSYPDGDEEFQHALEKSREHYGHQIILSALYHMEISSLQMKGMIKSYNFVDRL